MKEFLFHLRNMRENWLFWPLFLLLLSILMYNLLLSKSGYIVYLSELDRKRELEQQVGELIQKKSHLQKRLGILKDDEKALEKFISELYLYNSRDVKILKFQDNSPPREQEGKKGPDLILYQVLFVVFSSLVIAGSALYSWYFNFSPRNSDEEEWS